MTEHEDIELGRCVFHNTGVGCTTSYEMGTLFKNNYNIEETDSEGLKPVFEEVAGQIIMISLLFNLLRKWVLQTNLEI
jgi:hypothetical protein